MLVGKLDAKSWPLYTYTFMPEYSIMFHQLRDVDSCHVMEYSSKLTQYYKSHECCIEISHQHSINIHWLYVYLVLINKLFVLFILFNLPKLVNKPKSGKKRVSKVRAC